MAYYAIDPQLVDFIAQWEGFRAQPYNDPAGNATGGYGHLIHMGPLDGRASEAEWRNLTEAEGKRRLAADIVSYARAVDAAVTVPISYNQWRALVDFTFNVGPGNLQTSQLLVVLNSGDYAGVPAQLMRWVYGSDGVQYPGLVRRRKAEGELWNKEVEAVMTRGQPRIDYGRVVHVAPSNATLAAFLKIATAAYNTNKQTVGFSYDDAGVGDLSSRRAILWDIPVADRPSFISFYAQWYPGVVVEFMQTGASPVDPPPPPPSTTRKTGLGINAITGDMGPVNRALAAGATAISGINMFGQLSDLAAARQDLIVMARRYVSSMPPADPDVVFEGAGSPHLVYLTPLNECDNLCNGTVEQIKERASYDGAMWAKMKAKGRKYAGGGFSVGTTDYTNPAVVAAMRDYYAPLYNDGMGFNYHLYSPWKGHAMDIWYEFRWRFLFERCGFDPNPNLAGIYCDETGVDQGSVGGFSACQYTEAEVGAWCRQFLDLSQADGYGNMLRAAVIFQAGNDRTGGGGWAGYNVDSPGYLAAIGAAAKAPVTRQLARPRAPAYGPAPVIAPTPRKVLPQWE